MEPEGYGDDLEQLAAKTLRPPLRLSAEDLVASELASAVLSEPMGKIRHICEACMLLDEEERTQAGISDEEAKEAEKLYKLAIAFQNVFVDQYLDSTGHMNERSSTIQWPFSQREAKEWDDWLRPPGINLHWYYESHQEKEETDKLEAKIKDPSERTHALTQGRKLMCDSINCYKTHFTIKAMPKVAVLMKKIILLVSPDSYKQALQILRGGKRGKP